MTKSVLILRNPKSGAQDSRRHVDQVAELLSQKGFQVQQETDVDQLVKQSQLLYSPNELENRLQAVVAAGGDGTVSLLANRLPSGTPITICPLGTENLLAKHFGMTMEPSLIADLVDKGKVIQMDVGKANGKLFLVTASCGFDADVVRQLHSKRSGHISHWSYAGPVCKSIWNYRFPKIQITMDGAAKTVESRWAFTFNVPRYAMNLPLARSADPTDGKLDLCTFRGGGVLRGIFYLIATVLGRHQTWTSSQLHQGTKIRFESDQQVPFQIDGDPGGFLPLTIEILPSYLKLIVPDR